MRGLVRLAVQRRVSVVMFSLAVAAFGMVGYSRLSLELFPDISYPSVTVQTDFPDTAPQEVEWFVTRKVEEAVGVLPGLQQVHSVSRPGTSEVTLEFDWDSDMDLLSMEVREKLDRLILPEGAERPIVLRFAPSLDPILRIALSGRDPDELEALAAKRGDKQDAAALQAAELKRVRFIAEQRLKLDLETIKGVASAQIRGGLEEEIEVLVDQDRLAALDIPLENLLDVIGESNVNEPGGPLRGDETRYLVRIVNEFTDLSDIEDLSVVYRSGGSVLVKDIATVRWGAREREEITRVGMEEAVEISIYKQADANTVTIARKVRERIRAWEAERLPEGHDLTVLFDQSGFIRNAVDEVRNAALFGGLLAVFLLYLFLRDVRSTVIVATSIPLSVVATFLFMYRFDISLNIMSLGGLTLGIGMLVDSSIVVLESVYRRRQRGDSDAQAAINGTVEVGPAVIASTLTSVAVFLPIVFVEGIAGQLFTDQALTVTISLVASLVVAVTLIPMLSSLGGRRIEDSSRASPLSVESEPKVMTLGVVSRVYDGLLRGALRRRWLTIAFAAVAFVSSLTALSLLGTELMPPLSEGEFLFEVNLPEGTPIETTDKHISEMEKVAEADPDVDRTYSTVGTRLVTGGLSLNTKSENLGQINVVMNDDADDATEAHSIDNLRVSFQEIPDLDFKFGRPSYFSLKTPIEVVIFGEDLDELRAHSLDVARRLENIPGLVDVRSSLEAGHPELQVKFDDNKLAIHGLNRRALSSTIKSRVQGAVPTRFKKPDRQIDIRIRNHDEDKSSKSDIENLAVSSADGKQMPLLHVADVLHARGPAEIHRVQQQRAAVITANLDGRSLGGAINDVETSLAAIPKKDKMTTEIGGQNREMKVSFDSLKFALALAVFMVYLVMASVFESFIHPFIVLFTIPLSLVGVVIGLLATSTTITVVVLIGSVMLVGIVVNNAIVLIDRVNRYRRNGMEKLDAVVRAGHVRLRPIVMTTLTTILGLLPMAISWGDGSELRAPLAITVASGLFLSTLLTLVVIPAVYMITPSELKVLAGDEEDVE